ncbi:PRTRC system protein E [Janthinobacterium sp. GMG2]|uniref:PRTRC system protein E n=1 Tax=Janthinobacterium sp. GMG2 TaxID=3096606 RepID=UPI0029F51984|nr:PRTRC system protein E [Janthinobacterium sp. GMG2]MDX8121598.1 PRTRC system protein E [Janthinobacterium sp. GMG2]
MFTALHALTQSATLMIVVTAEGDDMRVSITPIQAGDKTKAHKLQPLSLVASPAELDDGFAAAIQSWQAPKLSLLQQVEAANAVGADPVASTASGKAAPKEAAKRSGPGRPKKNEGASPVGEGTAVTADKAGQQDDQLPPGNDAGAGEAPGAATQDGAVPPAGAADIEEKEENTLPPASNAAITAAVDTVTLDLF